MCSPFCQEFADDLGDTPTDPGELYRDSEASVSFSGIAKYGAQGAIESATRGFRAVDRLFELLSTGRRSDGFHLRRVLLADELRGALVSPEVTGDFIDLGDLRWCIIRCSLALHGRLRGLLFWRARSLAFRYHVERRLLAYGKPTRSYA